MRDNNNCFMLCRVLFVYKLRKEIQIWNFSAPKRHLHGPSVGKVKATRVMGELKQKAVDFPELLPSQIMRDLNVENIAIEVAANLPDVNNVRQALLRAKAKQLPRNPTNIQELEYIPRRFSVTKSGDFFLLYDSDSDEPNNLACGRIIIFATENNLRQLFRCKLWFADGTFKTVPAIFYQMFTVMGQFSYMRGGKQKKAARPLVYALLETKQEAAYHKVFEVIMSEARKLRIPVQIPERVMSDFELAIINAIETHFGKIFPPAGSICDNQSIAKSKVMACSGIT